MCTYGGSAIKIEGCARDDDTGERVVSQGDGFAAFLEDGILVSQPSPLG